MTANGGLEHVDRHNPGPIAEVLDTHESPASIGAKITSVGDVDWRSVEIMIGIPFKHVAEGGITAPEVWRRACAP